MILFTLCAANTLLSAQCELPKQANALIKLHDAYPAAVVQVLGEDQYQGILSNIAMLLAHTEIYTFPRPIEEIKLVTDASLVVPVTDADGHSAAYKEAPQRLFIDISGNPKMFQTLTF